MPLQTKILMAFAAVLVCLAGFYLVIELPPTPLPVALGLQSHAHSRAVVCLTNLTRSQWQYLVNVERKTAHGWPNKKSFPVGAYGGESGVLASGQVTNVSLPLFVYA